MPDLTYRTTSDEDRFDRAEYLRNSVDMTAEINDPAVLAAVRAVAALSTVQQVAAIGGLLNLLAAHCGRTSEAHGFHAAPGMEAGTGIDKRLLLTVSEVCEAQDVLRDGRTPDEVWLREKDGKPEGFVMELADVIIRVLDLCYVEGVDIGAALAVKWSFNTTRPALHGRAF